MKNILILGTNIAYSCGAVDNIMRKVFTQEPFDEFCLHAFSYGLNNKKKHIKKNAYSYSIKRPSYGFFGFFFRIINKIINILKLDIPFFGWSCLKKGVIKQIWGSDRIKIDCVIAGAGAFEYFKTALWIAKKENAKLILIYFDPFTENIYATNKKYRFKEEKKWCDYATRIFYDLDGKIPPVEIQKEKMVGFYIPIFNRDYVHYSKNNIVYGGLFYKDIRNPTTFYEFIETTKINHTFNIDVFSNLKKHPNYENVYYSCLISGDEFEKKCEECKALLVIGNSDVFNTLPSKLVDYLSYKKPIICINFNDYFMNKYLKDNPFFIIKTDNIFSEIDCFYEKKVFKENIYSFFPERNPEVLIKLIIESIND